eukprot:6204916-Pyramimonas_sp.AAC.1
MGWRWTRSWRSSPAGGGTCGFGAAAHPSSCALYTATKLASKFCCDGGVPWHDAGVPWGSLGFPSMMMGFPGVMLGFPSMMLGARVRRALERRHASERERGPHRARVEPARQRRRELLRARARGQGLGRGDVRRQGGRLVCGGGPYGGGA